ncbi:MAG: polysaccharide biosynthesis/export family protein [Pseudomonadales bacterium]|nr:polysaccharide biosynthesis/export family protein [Pseudomonadales bacterium]
MGTNSKISHLPRTREVVRAVLTGALLTLLAACNSTPAPNASMTATEKPVDLTKAGLMEAYKVGVGDTLRVSVWRNPELSADVVVLPDGTISVPLAGDVEAAGETTESLKERIAAVLNNYIRQPEVTVSVLSATSSEYLQRVRITGAVNAPQSLTFRRGLTVMDIVLLAGGLTPYANPNKALLYRKEGDKMQRYPVKLDDILSKGKLETNYALLPNDIITVPEKSF